MGGLWDLVGCGRLRRENTRLRAQLQAVRQELARQAHAARHDELTGLANRRLLAGDWEAAAAMMIDLDGFKVVNDDIGHDAGDQVLVVVARRLVQGLGAGWVPLRLGGDEFAAVHDGEVDEATAAAQADVLAGQLARPMLIQGQRLRVGCSIGLAVRRPEPAHVLLKAADTALAVAKQRSGRPPLAPGAGDDAARPRLRVRELSHAVLDEMDLSMLVVVNGDGATPVRPVRVIARVAAPGDPSTWAPTDRRPWPAADTVSPAGRTGGGPRER